MSEFGRRFDPSELADADGGAPGDPATIDLLAVARDLEAFARSESVTPSADFESRVMAVIAAEPTPRSVGTGGLLGLVSAVRDAWRLTWTTERPLLVRGQALAVVLLAVVALGSVGSLAAVGVTRLLSQTPAVVEPSPLPTPSPSMLKTMEPSPSPSPSITPSPSPTPTASPTPKAAVPTSTVEPNKTAEPTDNSGPGSGSGSGTGGDSSGPGAGETAEPSDDTSSSGSGSGDGAEDFETPRPTDYDSSGPGSGEEIPGSEPGS